MSNAILFRMPSGIPGDISRRQSATVEQVLFDSTLPFPAYGVVGKLSAAGKFVPLVGGEAASAIYGLLVRPYPHQTANSDGSGVQTTGLANVLRRGFMTVLNRAGTPAMGSAVYVRVAAASGSKIIGGIEAVADGTNTVVMAGATFKGAADAAGNAEIEFNI